jgi:hypothetical protein
MHPLAGSHVSIVQGSPSSQSIGVLRQPRVLSQASTVQALWSSQLTGAWTHCPLTHVSIVQALWSSQSIGAWTQVWLTHVSVVQASPSSQSPSLVQQPAIGVRPQVVPSHVAVRQVAVGHGLHDVPQCATSVSRTHDPLQAWKPAAQTQWLPTQWVCSAEQSASAQQLPVTHCWPQHR